MLNLHNNNSQGSNIGHIRCLVSAQMDSKSHLINREDPEETHAKWVYDVSTDLLAIKKAHLTKRYKD